MTITEVILCVIIRSGSHRRHPSLASRLLGHRVTIGRVITVPDVHQAYDGPVRLILTTASYASSSDLLSVLNGGYSCHQNDWGPVLYT